MHTSLQISGSNPNYVPHFHVNFYLIYEKRVEFYQQNTEIVKIDVNFCSLIFECPINWSENLKNYIHDLRRALPIHVNIFVKPKNHFEKWRCNVVVTDKKERINENMKKYNGVIIRRSNPTI